MICSVLNVDGRYGVETWAVYSVTKFAVVGFYDALRRNSDLTASACRPQRR